MEITRKPHLHHDWIDSHAYGIVKALQKASFTTYLVGGCVRDLLLGIHPKDFDIATSAHPPQVKRNIYMSFIIGKRFRLVLVKREQQQFEVATFRREIRPEELEDPNTPAGDNVFGTPEEDARRRDFTINGLFYDPVNEQLIDFVHGLADVEARILRMIGDPDVRLPEDSIRILRGLRLAHKLGLVIEPGLRAGMERHANELAKAVLPRRREEILKILRLDEPEILLMECLDLGVLKHVIPTLHSLLEDADRRELFLQHFNQYRHIVRDPSDTTQLFGWLVLAMLRTAQESPSMRTEPITIEDDIFQGLMREELGMYKFEQSALVQAFEMMPNLVRTEDFKRRGERRQVAFMKNEGFKPALAFAEADLQLSAEQLTFWRTTYKKLAGEIEVLAAEAKSKRRRRPRRTRRPGEDRSKASDNGLDTSDDSDVDDDIDDESDDSDRPFVDPQ